MLQILLFKVNFVRTYKCMERNIEKNIILKMLDMLQCCTNYICMYV